MPAPSQSRYLLIPFAGSAAPGCRAALPGLHLPNLEALLARLTLESEDTQAESTLTPPHERALAAALGITAVDGCIPWAALEARRSGLAAADDTSAWAWATLCNWQVDVDDVVLGDPAAIEIDDAESETLLHAAKPFFEEDGIALHATSVPGRWLARGSAFEGLATASIDRVIGQPISQWSPPTDTARALRRLQNEMQMLLYTERVNDERTGRGVLPINSFWISGTGTLAGSAASAATDDASTPTVIDTLRPAALRNDGQAWADDWRALDAGPLAALLDARTRGENVTLTLCGDRTAQRFTTQKIGFGRRMKALLNRKRASTVLETL